MEQQPTSKTEPTTNYQNLETTTTSPSSSSLPQQSKNENDGALNAMNYINVVAYIANICFVYYVGVRGINDLPNNAEVSVLYQSLVTPAPFAFSIWSLIFLSQGIFTLVQLHPQFRHHPQVQHGVRYFYAIVCFFQILWTYLFVKEKMWFAFGCILAILFSLILLMDSQHSSTSDKTHREFWLLRFPFAIHLGWIFSATVVNLNVLFVANKSGPNTQVVIAGMSLLILITVAATALHFPKKPFWVVATVQAWTTIAIWIELENPEQLIQAWFTSQIIGRVRLGSAISCIIIICLILHRVYLYFSGKQYNSGIQVHVPGPAPAPSGGSSSGAALA